MRDRSTITPASTSEDMVGTGRNYRTVGRCRWAHVPHTRSVGCNAQEDDRAREGRKISGRLAGAGAAVGTRLTFRGPDNAR